MIWFHNRILEVTECILYAGLNRSVMSDSSATPWTAAHQALLSVGTLQARILEWVATPSSRGSSQPGG